MVGAVPLVAAVFLPYFAVVIANVSVEQGRVDVQRPAISFLWRLHPPGPAIEDDREGQ